MGRGKLYLLLGIFSIAMAFLESAVVIYLRELLYPGGFSFPLKELNNTLALTELLRELATLIMLVAVGFLAGRKFSMRFAWFIYSFAVWDIFYYVFLILMIGWPGSIMEWDVLFLIPLTWTGPVLTPLLVCLLMISFSLIITGASARGKTTGIKAGEWVLLVGGSVILILAFTWDYGSYILQEFSFRSLWNMPDVKPLLSYATAYVPVSFPWVIFTIACMVILSAIVLYALRVNRTTG